MGSRWSRRSESCTSAPSIDSVDALGKKPATAPQQVNVSVMGLSGEIVFAEELDVATTTALELKKRIAPVLAKQIRQIHLLIETSEVEDISLLSQVIPKEQDAACLQIVIVDGGPKPVVLLAGVVPNNTNLMDQFPDLVLGGAMSFMATVKCTSLRDWGRVFHFGPHNDQKDVDSIGLNNQHSSSTVGLYIYDERQGAHSVGFVRKKNAWVVGEEATWLVSVSTKGVMTIWKDGVVLATGVGRLGEGGGKTPRRIHRKYLLIGSHPQWGQHWKGSIKDVRVWNEAVTWDEVA